MMEQPNQFRSSFNGFNREDVVRYMEFINNKHSAQVAQLTNELEYLRGKQDTLDSTRVSELEKQLSAARAENEVLKHRIAALERSLEEANAALSQPAAPAPAAPAATPSESELEAYRRAERVERVAKERARQLGQQTADALGRIHEQMDQVSASLSETAEEMAQQLTQLQEAVALSRQTLEDAAGMAQALNAEIDG